MAFFASGMVGRLRKSSEIIRNCRKMAENSFIRDTKQNNIGLFEADFASFWKKFTVSKNFLLLVLKCLKFNSVSCYIEIPSFRPSCVVILSKYSIMNSIRRGIDSIAFTWMVTNVFYGTEARSFDFCVHRNQFVTVESLLTPRPSSKWSAGLVFAVTQTFSYFDRTLRR